MIALAVILFFLSTIPQKSAANLTNFETLRKENSASFEGLATLIANLVSVDNSDLVFISDFKNPQQVNLVFFFIHSLPYVVLEKSLESTSPKLF